MELKLRYRNPAPDSEEGWERYSLPIGNSYMGGNVFGGVEYERIQITENSLQNPGHLGGLNSFADILIRFPHTAAETENYERGLDIGKALAYIRYDCAGIHVEREYFASYPDRALAGTIIASAPVSCEIALQIPFLTEEEGREKRGSVNVIDNEIIMTGFMCAYNIRFAGQLRVFTNGVCIPGTDSLQIKDATELRFVFCCATNYELRPEVFTESDNHKKLRDFDPLPIVTSALEAACQHNADELKERHILDYTAL
ncbi:MAG: glycoside hydrolase N-terminal domain-containing protein, partial [Clostridia bacterium]|nr:glycoside hydrolase N-terminal domain-containing protein [Clostridia bacterium]